MSSTALLNPNTEVAKTKKSKQKTATLSYEDAVAVLRDCDEQLKKAQKIRISDYVPLRYSLGLRTFIKSAVIVGVAETVVFQSIGGVDFSLIMASVFIAPSMVLLPRKAQAILSPFAARRTNREISTTQALCKLKEDHFDELKESILKKAEPAMDVINEHIKDFHQKIVYPENNYYETAKFGLETAIDGKGYRTITPLEMIGDLSVDGIRENGRNQRRNHTNALTV